MKYVEKGNIVYSECHTLVCPINVVGAMGKGLALQMARRYPGLMNFYLKHYPRTDTPAADKVYQIERFTTKCGKQILLVPTKSHWRDSSHPMWILKNLQSLVDNWFEWDIRSLAIPALGCGEGGLSWDTVRPMMEEAFKAPVLEGEIYLPDAFEKWDSDNPHRTDKTPVKLEVPQRDAEKAEAAQKVLIDTIRDIAYKNHKASKA